MSTRTLSPLTLLAGALGVVFLASCVVEPDESATPIGTAATSDAPVQDLVWAACGVGECATLMVPMDWSDPAGETIGLELRRVPARGESIGSLVINPGGPGIPGTGVVDDFHKTAGEHLLD